MNRYSFIPMSRNSQWSRYIQRFFDWYLVVRCYSLQFSYGSSPIRSWKCLSTL